MVAIPQDELGQVVEIPLGFQPFGIAVRRLDNVDKIVITDYFAPAVCTAVVRRDNSGVRFEIEWIRGVRHGIQSVRLFPDVQPSGANRAQTVVFGPDGNLWVSRNGERDFFVLQAPSRDGDQWNLIRRILLPNPEGLYQMVHSALWTGSLFLTVESWRDLTHWTFNSYDVQGEKVIRIESVQVPDWTYGIGQRGDVPNWWFVTDFRSSQQNGVYRMGSSGRLELVVRGIYGNGIAFLSDGSALVTRYGQGNRGAFNGVPGALIYVPRQQF